MPDGRRIQIGWARTAQYTESYPDQIVSQAFTLPHELTLGPTPEGLRLRFNPVKECELLRGSMLADCRDLSVTEAQQALQIAQGRVSEVIIEFAESGSHALTINGTDASFAGTQARIFTDTTLTEIYADGGLYYEVRTKKDLHSAVTEIRDSPGSPVKTLKVWELKSIW